MTREVKRHTVRLRGSDGTTVLLKHPVVYLDGIVEPIEYNGRLHRFEYANTDREGAVRSLEFRQVGVPSPESVRFLQLRGSIDR
jgi:hypothetical protein